jgi:hypothetical protein
VKLKRLFKLAQTRGTDLAAAFSRVHSQQPEGRPKQGANPVQSPITAALQDAQASRLSLELLRPALLPRWRTYQRWLLCCQSAIQPSRREGLTALLAVVHRSSAQRDLMMTGQRLPSSTPSLAGPLLGWLYVDAGFTSPHSSPSRCNICPTPRRRTESSMISAVIVLAASSSSSAMARLPP